MGFYQTKINNENVKLAWDFSVSKEKCDNSEHYQNYLKFNAFADVKEGYGTTYLYIKENEFQNDQIVGYITLRTSSFIKDVGATKKYGFPALEISELAVHEDYVNNGIGSDMVIDAINKANELNEIVSIKYIILCADPKVEYFYKNLDFRNMNKDFEEIPREHYNVNCVPMYLKLR